MRIAVSVSTMAAGLAALGIMGAVGHNDSWRVLTAAEGAAWVGGAETSTATCPNKYGEDTAVKQCNASLAADTCAGTFGSCTGECQYTCTAVNRLKGDDAGTPGKITTTTSCAQATAKKCDVVFGSGSNDCTCDGSAMVSCGQYDTLDPRCGPQT